MTGYRFASQSIAHNDGLQPYDFSGSYNGGGYTITIGNVVSAYTGLFDSITSNTIQNINVIYNNPITVTVTGTTAQSWGGIVGIMTSGTITNCSVTTNAAISITSGQADASHGIFCGFMGQDSVITNSQLIINNTIIIEGIDNNSIGLFCGFVADSAITNCSITVSSGSYSISLKVTDDDPTPGNYSSIGIICGLCSKVFTVLNNALIEDITVNLNNDGSIILDRTGAGAGTIYKGAICGSLDGDGDPTSADATNCVININNNQTLTGGFEDFFGNTVETPTIQNCQFRYTTTTNNTSRPLTISPTPAVAPVIYVNNYSNTYQLDSGSYYIPNTSASLSIGSQNVALQSQSPAGLVINGTLYPVTTSFSSSTPEYRYAILVKGVGSMYFGLDLTAIIPPSINSSIECICQINSCATNPQTGVTEDSRITNTIQDKTIRVNVDREFAVNSIIAPKFNSYSDYMKYLQGALRR
jgi:hypothetical protein